MCSTVFVNINYTPRYVVIFYGNFLASPATIVVYEIGILFLTEKINFIHALHIHNQRSLVGNVLVYET